MSSTIGVQNIAHTNGTNAMTVDSSGRVLQPTKPAFMARGYGSLNTASSLTVNSITPASSIQIAKSFTIVDVNVGSSFNNTTGKFTCPVAGLYQVMYHIGFKAGHQYTETHLFLTSNDSVDYGYITQWTPDISTVGQNNGSGATVLINASANQEFAIGFDTSSGYTTPLVATSSLKEHFSFGAYLIG